MLIDIGVNLTSKQFRADRDAVITRGLAHGVTHMVLTGTSITESAAALELARARPDVLSSTAGIHPHDASSFDANSLCRLRELAADSAVVAIGECGLDYNRDFSPRELQVECFRQQLQLAVETQLPVFMHQRDAHTAFMEALSPIRSKLGRAVVHCFTGTESELRDYLDLDLYIGITGWICDERRGTNLRSIVNQIPLDRLMIETDAPYLIPRDLVPKPKSRRNEPQYLGHIARVLATLMNVEFETLVSRTYENSTRFFNLGNQVPG